MSWSKESPGPLLRGAGRLQSANNDSEVLSDFTHRLRTTVSRVRFAERNQPLFIRHAHSIKRSMAKA